MEDKLNFLIMAGSRDNCDSVDMEEMYLWVTEVISDHQTRYKHVAVAVRCRSKVRMEQSRSRRSDWTRRSPAPCPWRERRSFRCS